MNKFNIENNQAILRLPKKVSHNIFFNINMTLEPISYIIIDFYETTSVTLSGLTYLICLTGHYNRRTTNNISRIYCEIINLKDYLLKFIMNFGFIQQMSKIGNLYRVNGIDILINKDLIETEKIFVKHQFNKKSLGYEDAGLIMPFSTIVIGEMRHYESYVRNFRNNFYEYYSKLIQSGLFSLPSENIDFIQEDFYEFTITIFEIIKNIFDHSQSWGLGAIHFRKIGVEIVYYDIGCGIINSMKSCINYCQETDENVLKLALLDGNSSKIGNGENKGRGFKKMIDFTKKRNGFLSIRTDSYHINNGKIEKISWFPGTQIVIFIPN